MNLILLGGQSILNKNWVNEVSNSVVDLFHHRSILDYDHWRMGNDKINLDLELVKLGDLASNLDEYAVFAKSLGAVLALKAVNEGVIKPKFLVICGLAYLMAEDLELPIQNWLENNNLPTLIIQKEHDPAMSGLDLRTKIDSLKSTNYQLNIISGDNHQYEDINLIKESLKMMISSSAN